MGFFAKLKGIIMASKTAKIACVAGVLIVGAGGTAGLVYADVFTNASKVVQKAVEAVEEAEPSVYEEVFGTDALLEAIKKNGAELGVDVTLPDISGESLGLGNITIPKIGVDMMFRYQMEQKLMDTRIGLKVAGAKLLTAELYANEEELQLAVPKLSKKVLALGYTQDNLREQMEGSYLLGTFLSSDAFVEEAQPVILDSIELVAEGLKQLGKPMTEQETVVSFADFSDKDIAVKKAGKKKIEVDGKKIECRVYTASVDGSKVAGTVADFVSGFLNYENIIRENITGEEPVEQTGPEELKVYFEEKLENVKVTTYVSNGRMVQQQLKAVIDGRELEITNTCRADAGTSDYINVQAMIPVSEEETMEISHRVSSEKTEEGLRTTWELMLNEEVLCLEFDYTMLDDSFTLAAAFGSDVSITLEGVFGELEKGKKIGLELEKVTLVADGEESAMELDAELYLAALEEGETIEKPKGTRMDVLAMTEKNVEDLQSEIETKISMLALSLLGLFGQ